MQSFFLSSMQSSIELFLFSDLNPVHECIFVGSSHAVSRESTKILGSVQNDQTSKACTKVLKVF